MGTSAAGETPPDQAGRFADLRERELNRAIERRPRGFRIGRKEPLAPQTIIGLAGAKRKPIAA